MTEDNITNISAMQDRPDELKVRYDQYGMPIPEEEKFEDVTAEEIIRSINANDNMQGFCDCVASVQLMKVKLRENPEEATEDDYEELGGFSIQNFRADFYGFTPALCAINLIFDSPDDDYYRDAWNLLKRYREELEKNEDREHVDYYFALTLIPNRYSGRCFATLSQPLDFFRTINPDSELIESTIHLIFSYDTVTFQNVTMTADEMIDYRMHVEEE